jgi:hypothetical protein
VGRDGGCRFPGCDRAASWCDVHHVQHWINGGETAPENLLLLCRRHHRLLHHGWTVSGPARAPAFMRPDGIALEVTPGRPREGPAS